MNIKFVVAGVLGFAGAFAFSGGHSLAASAQQVPVATFDRTLEVLRQSVADLVKENKALNARNLEMRARVKELNEELRSLQAEALRLQDRRSSEEQRSKARGGRAEALKEQVAAADAMLKQVRMDVAAQQGRLDQIEKEGAALEQKSAQLSADIAAMRVAGASSQEAREEIAQLRSQRDALQPAVNEAVKRVQEAKKQWEEASALAVTGPEQVDAIKAERDFLDKEIPRIEADLAKIDAQFSEAQAALGRFQGNDYSDMRLGRLDSELKDMLERNRKLEEEISAIQKNRELRLKRIAEESERARRQYESDYKEVSARNAALKVELELLRKQMVELDKKKALIEAAVYKTP